ncbi:Flp pilus assembly protein TadB [uncultured Clostridium sp.]|nr:Flp pilus assembly protein TadB [uncultured Clostridium sp.]
MNGSRFMTLFIKPNYFRQDIKKREYLLTAVRCMALMGLIAFLYYDSFWAVPALLPIGFGYFLQWEQECMEKKRVEFQKQFQESIRALSASLGAGYSVENAMKETKKELSVLYRDTEPIQREFTYMIRQIHLHIPIEQIIEEWAERTGQEDVYNFAAVFAAAKRSGGNMTGIIKNAIRQIEDKLAVAEEIETILAAKKYEFKVMSAVPFGVIAYMKVSFPEFMDVLYGSSVGIGVMSGCLGVYIAAYLLGRKIINIEV